jgi:hypothetical protein
MRALCGAIITAGAVIGLGLTALGIGTRYNQDPFVSRNLSWRSSTDGKPSPEAKGGDNANSGEAKGGEAKAAGTTEAAKDRDRESQPFLVHLYQMDRPLVFTLVFLTIVAVIGLGIAFFGLAYHHRRRYHEHLREQERTAAQQRTSV